MPRIIGGPLTACSYTIICPNNRLSDKVGILAGTELIAQVIDVQPVSSDRKSNKTPLWVHTSVFTIGEDVIDQW